MTCSKKPHSIWPNGLEDMPLWSSKNFWEWFDHNLPTTHEKWVFLDFLEMGEQDIQLSCWAKFHLKLVWWSNFEDQDFPFLANSNYRSTFYFWKFLVWLQILHCGCLTCYMRLIWTWMRPLKPIPTIKSLIKCTVDHSWLQLTLLGFWLTEPCSDEFQTLIPWDLDSKWCHNI